jgi:putative pyoverdin transport system ATP-binding/permease protein
MKVFRQFHRLLKEIPPVWVVVTTISGLVLSGVSIFEYQVLNYGVFYALDGPQHGLTSELLPPVWVGLLLLAMVFKVLRNVPINYVAEQTSYRVRARLTDVLLSSPLWRLEQRGASRIYSTLIEDVDTVSRAIATVPIAFQSFFVLVGSIAYLGTISPLFVGILVPFWATLGVLLDVRVRQLISQRLEVFRSTDQLFKNFGLLIHGMKELKLNSVRRQAFVDKRLKAFSAEATRRSFRSESRLTLFYSFSVLSVLPLGLLTFGGGERFGLTTQEIVVGLFIALNGFSAFEAMSGAFSEIGRSQPAMERIDELGTKVEEEILTQEAPKSDWRSLELRDVTYRYAGQAPSETFGVGPLNVRFRPAEVVFVVGGNGSGKTTFSKVLTGLYTPQTGSILLDGKAVTPQTLDAYRQNFSTVMSDFQLFEDMDGLLSPAALARSVTMLEKMQLHRKVRIDERGISNTNLSQGQRKRLALITALLEDKPIYLFDEWAADQDPEFKEYFYKEILPELRAQGKTLIVISHDDRYFPVADRIIQLDEGHIVRDSLMVPQAVGQIAS